MFAIFKNSTDFRNLNFQLRILKYVKSTNGNPPEFAQDQENDGHANHSRHNVPDVLPSCATVSTSRSLSASSDVTAQGAGQSTAPLSENSLLPFDCQHVADAPCAAQLKHELAEQASDADSNNASQRLAADNRGELDENSENRIDRGAPSDEENARDGMQRYPDWSSSQDWAGGLPRILPLSLKKIRSALLRIAQMTVYT